MKRVNDSSHNLSCSINPNETKKIREDSLLQEEVNNSRWELLIQQPEKNSVLLSNEMKSIVKANVIISFDYFVPNLNKNIRNFFLLGKTYRTK